MADNFIPIYDLESLTEPQRQDYIKAVCKHMGVPDNLNLVSLTLIDDGEGPARLVAYAKRGATENVRNNLKISITSLTSQMIGGSIVFTAVAKDGNGRQEVSTGSKYIAGLEGMALDDAIMTSQTRALRRVTLQYVGAGVLDESEIHTGKTVQFKQPPVTSQIAPQPIVQPDNLPGKDITPRKTVEEVLTNPTGPIGFDKEPIVSDFAAQQEEMRAEAIRQLNLKHAQDTHKIVGTPESADGLPAKKTRKPRGPNKPKVNLGPSSPVNSVSVTVETPVKTETTPTVPIPEPPKPVEPPKLVEAAPTPVVPVKPRLSPDQVKPFRQRLFKLVNEYLEPNGFAPKEGIGNSDKMRQFAQILFPEVANLNELTIEQWEKYLTTLEKKQESEGPAATIKYIEESIGI